MFPLVCIDDKDSDDEDVFRVMVCVIVMLILISLIVKVRTFPRHAAYMGVR